MNRKKIARIIALVSGFLGLSILAFVLLPIISYELFSSTSSYLSPIPKGDMSFYNEGLKTLGSDSTKASNWFVGQGEENSYNGEIVYYSLSIPKLKISNATVAFGGEDLSKSLIQYPGTAAPGKRGNAVIFGHSILPQFYNPKDYISIFSTLPTLKRGDEINISFDGIYYQYQVEDMFEVKPTDIEVLEQNLSDSFLTLVTCTPPGHPLRPKRLIVRARIINPEEGALSNENFRS